MHPKEIRIQDYSYELPQERIAQFPLEKRHESRLLIWENQEIHESTYADIANHLPERTTLVFNNTKVIEARILFQKETGGIIELFCLEPGSDYSDISIALQQTKNVIWHCMVGGASKWKAKTELVKRLNHYSLTAIMLEKRTDYFVIQFTWNEASKTFADVLHEAGVIPLPPYMHRQAEEKDKQRYQTVYAKEEGSVAAPTAGLHFTEEVFQTFLEKGIQRLEVTLHVGAGTFKPVKSERMEEHDMHAEYMDVSIETLENILAAFPRLVAVGTTSLRTLESLYLMGMKCLHIPDISLSDLEIKQWDAYQLKQENVSTEDALKALIAWMKRNQINRLICKTQLLIAPPYRVKMVQGLITNFHQPQSTLLLLVASLVGKEHWRTIYNYALDHPFRFLSYGDGCLLWQDK